MIEAEKRRMISEREKPLAPKRQRNGKVLTVKKPVSDSEDKPEDDLDA